MAKGFFGSGLARFKPNEQQPWPEWLMYDLENEHSPECATERLTLSTFCTAMRDLKMKHLVFVGDSLSHNMAYALWTLLGRDTPLPDGLAGQFSMSDVKSKKYRTFSCPGDLPDFTFDMFRNDNLLVPDHELAHKCAISGRTAPVGSLAHNYSLICDDICTPWISRLEQFTEPVLLMLNIGAHIHDKDRFVQDTNRAAAWVKEHFTAKKRGIVYWRQNVAGHDHCEGHKAPLTDAEYADGGYDVHTGIYKSRFTYHLVPAFNEHGGAVFKDAGARILDIWPMTKLRIDGHRACYYDDVAWDLMAVNYTSGPLPACPNDANDPEGNPDDWVSVPGMRIHDCLHYQLPGVPDWWNHLWYTELRAIHAQAVAGSTCE
jgi:hypothetical protein